MAMCLAVETCGPAFSSIGSKEVSGPAICFQIATPTEVTRFDIATPTVRVLDANVDECFECDDSDDDSSRIPDDSDCESEAETEASPKGLPMINAASEKIRWDKISKRIAFQASMDNSDDSIDDIIMM